MTSKHSCSKRRVRPECVLALALALTGCAGEVAHDTATAAIAVPLGLPVMPHPPDNPPTAVRIELGRKLFFDRRLSFNGTMSCGMCHVPDHGFTANELRMAIGNEGATVRRNAPTVLNVGYHPRLFHDGREGELEAQVWGPFLAHNEMANPSIGHVLDKLRTLPDYQGAFERAFDGRGPTVETVGQALASYQRSLVSANSRFDRYRYGSDETALTAQERQGLEVFAGKGRCTTCHAMGEQSALFSDFRYHNTGIGWLRGLPQPLVEVQLVPGLQTTMTAERIDSIGEKVPNDVGRFEITLDPNDRWAYKTPMLRNVALTAPYMHDGSLSTLEAVVDFYDRGGGGAPDQSPLIVPLHLDDDEKTALVAFLKTLTGEHQRWVDEGLRQSTFMTTLNPITDSGPAATASHGR
ncbi:cytochrome-c peroxidase [Methyloversatilis sp.]|uniref:cytochrome-c peroxidase n=1 Tax=Methyloversatilis sp. TaxID=2569862 RepID=UPI003D2E9500